MESYRQTSNGHTCACTHTYLVVISKVAFVCVYVFVGVCMCVYTPFIDRTCLSTVYRIPLKSRLKASFQSLFEAKLFHLDCLQNDKAAILQDPFLTQYQNKWTNTVGLSRNSALMTSTSLSLSSTRLEPYIVAKFRTRGAMLPVGRVLKSFLLWVPASQFAGWKLCRTTAW